jgi:hypothetical protein
VGMVAFITFEMIYKLTNKKNYVNEIIIVALLVIILVINIAKYRILFSINLNYRESLLSTSFRVAA